MEDQATTEPRSLATVEAIEGESRVKVTPYVAGSGCMCHKAITVAREAVASVTPTEEVPHCCGKRFTVVEVSFADDTLNDVFAQISGPAAGQDHERAHDHERMSQAAELPAGPAPWSGYGAPMVPWPVPASGMRSGGPRGPAAMADWHSAVTGSPGWPAAYGLRQGPFGVPAAGLQTEPHPHVRTKADCGAGCLNAWTDCERGCMGPTGIEQCRCQCRNSFCNCMRGCGYPGLLSTRFHPDI